MSRYSVWIELSRDKTSWEAWVCDENTRVDVFVHRRQEKAVRDAISFIRDLRAYSVLDVAESGYWLDENGKLPDKQPPAPH